MLEFAIPDAKRDGLIENFIFECFPSASSECTKSIDLTWSAWEVKALAHTNASLIGMPLRAEFLCVHGNHFSLNSISESCVHNVNVRIFTWEEMEAKPYWTRVWWINVQDQLERKLEGKLDNVEKASRDGNLNHERRATMRNGVSWIGAKLNDESRQQVQKKLKLKW